MSHLVTLGSLTMEVADILRYTQLLTVLIKNIFALRMIRIPITEETIYTTKSSSMMLEAKTQME